MVSKKEMHDLMEAIQGLKISSNQLDLIWMMYLIKLSSRNLHLCRSNCPIFISRSSEPTCPHHLR
ncbi:hypothetical protein LINGRAHAP2_LOCUS14252 [Linum grandiflorum]